MTAIALVVMVGSLTVVWGGLVASTVYLRRHPEQADAEMDGAGEPIVMHDL